MSNRPTRRDWIKATSAGVAALASVQAAAAKPGGEIQVRQTAGAKRYAAEQPLAWRSDHGRGANSISLDPSKKYQDILGFGAAFTDAACYTFNQLSAESREKLFHEMFDPSQMGLNVCRLCLGASDYATKMYSYDEGDPDPDMQRFSIDHDREYILPMLQLGRKVNPDLFLFGSPWSPPGWMKAGGSMLGGSMRKSNYAPYAKYFVKFLQAYQQAGVPVNAVSVQNEVDTDQDGKMPACLWGQEYEMEFVAKFLGPQIAANKLDTKIWVLDHNYSLWGRAIDELEDPEVRKYVDGIAWHGYVGEPKAMTRVHEAFPDKHMYWTEGGPDYTEPDYLTGWAKWSNTFSGILRNWARCIIGWNLALDEKGRPNIGPFPCGGVVTVNSETREITRSGQYWAFMHYSNAVRRGARRIDSASQLEKVAHVVFANPDGSSAAVLTNSGAAAKVVLRQNGAAAEVNLPADSVTTLTWKA